MKEYSDEELKMMKNFGELDRKPKEEQKTNDLNKQGWFRIEHLPTNFKWYENKELYGRQLRLLDVKDLSKITPDSADYLVNRALKNSIKGIDYRQIKLIDKLYLIFWLREVTFPKHHFQINFTCPECGMSQDYMFDLSHLKVDYIDEDYDEHKQYIFPTGEMVTIEPLDIGQEEEIVKTIKQLPEEDKEFFDEELLSDAYHISSVNGKVLTIGEILTFLSKDPANYVHLNNLINQKLRYGINNVVTAKCSKDGCGGAADLAVNFCRELFIPYTL